MLKSQELPVSSAIIVFDGKLLLLQRDNTHGIRDPECWQLPGGGVEEGETPDEAVRRELVEEIGIIPTQLRRLGTPYPSLSLYYALLSKQEVAFIKKGDEGKDLKFFSLEECVTLPLTQKLREAFRTQRTVLESLVKK